MRKQNNDIVLYDSGVHTLINSVTNPLFAYSDKNALSSLVGYLCVYLAQGGSLGILFNSEIIEHFILHAQRDGILGVSFENDSFDKYVRARVPADVPGKTNVYLSSPGAGLVNASCSVVDNADGYELWFNGASVAEGVEDSGTVNFAASGLPSGEQSFRVVAKSGDFLGFPGPSNTVDIQA